MAPVGNQTGTETAEPEGTAVTGTGVTETNEPESDSDIEFIEEVPKKPKKPLVVGLEDMTAEEGVDGIKIEPKSEPTKEIEEPTPSTSTAGVLDPTNLGLIQEQIQQLTRLFNQHLSKTDSTTKEVQSGRD